MKIFFICLILEFSMAKAASTHCWTYWHIGRQLGKIHMITLPSTSVYTIYMHKIDSYHVSNLVVKLP